MEEVSQTAQLTPPPAPPRPSVPVEVPNDVVLTEDPLSFDASLQLDEPLTVLPNPPPPRPKEEARQQAEEEPEIFVIVEEMPRLVGGLEAIQKQLRYPEIAQRAGIEGRVFVEFVVDEQGKVVNPGVLRGIGGGCDEEALRAISQATFTPGRQRGRPVRVRMSIPVLFKLKDAYR